MREFDERVQSWLRTHHQTIPGRELEAAGISVDQRERMVTAGHLVRVVDGVYALAGVSTSTMQRCAALCAGRPNLVVAGPTAGWIWKLRRCKEPTTVHVLSPAARTPCRETWVTPFRTASIHDEDVVRRDDGIVMTSPPRTVVDLVRYLNPLDLMSALESALSAEMCTESSLARTAKRLATQGRPWASRFLRLLEGRTPGGPRASDGEIAMYEALSAAGIPGLVSQFWIDLPGYGRARYDVAIPELRWALEVDLHPEHRTIEGQDSDQRRDAAAEMLGWRMRRVGELAVSEARLPATVASLVLAIDLRRRELASLTRVGRFAS